MKKLSRIFVMIAATLGFYSTAFATPLPDYTRLTIELGNALQTAPCSTGSCFGMEVSPGFFLYTNISSFNGIILGSAQPAVGSHSGPINGSESPDIDNPWSFFGNTGMHQTTSPIVVNNDCTVDLAGWDVTWNGIPSIPMGGDPGNFPEDTSLGQLILDGIGRSYTIDYAGHVPLGSPSGFGGVQYTLHLEGAVDCVDCSISTADVICDGLDDDCDGQIDEDYVPTPTTCGVGECASTGEMICENGTMVDTCVPGLPSAESCSDGLDNDCDGQIDECEDSCLGGVMVETIRGGGQRPTTTDLQIQTRFTVLNGDGRGCIVDHSVSTITVISGTVLAFNGKVGNGPDPCFGELDGGGGISVDLVNVIICDEAITGRDTHRLVFHNKCNGGKDTDRMTIKIVK